MQDYRCGQIIGSKPRNLTMYEFREDVIKLQHKMKGTREKWRGSTYDFYLIAHEHLYVFRKPAEGEDRKDVKYSVKWR